VNAERTTCEARTQRSESETAPPRRAQAQCPSNPLISTIMCWQKRCTAEKARKCGLFRYFDLIIPKLHCRISGRSERCNGEGCCGEA